MSDDFKNHPVSLTEVRAHRTRRASDWTPRDVLIDLLRQIDSGEANPEALVVCHSEFDDEGLSTTSYSVSSPNMLVTLGMMARAATDMQRRD